MSHYITPIIYFQVIFGYYDVLKEGWCFGLRRISTIRERSGRRTVSDIPEHFNKGEGKKEGLEQSLGNFRTAKAALDLGKPIGCHREPFDIILGFRTPSPRQLPRIMGPLGFAIFPQVTKSLLPCDLGRN